MATVGGLLILLLEALWALLCLWSLVWMYRDASARDWPALALVLVAFLTWPVGLAIYWLATHDREHPARSTGPRL